MHESIPFRILVAGTGSIGRRHIGNLRRLLPQARYGFLRTHGRHDELSAELDAEVFHDVPAAVAWQPSLAVVANPSDQHASVTLPLLKAQVPTFIEKPVVIRDCDVSALNQLVFDGLPTTQVGCVLRFLPSLRVLKTWLDEGRLGNIVRASFEVGQWLPDWRPAQDYRRSYSASRKQGGGVVFDLIHEIDLACWFFGEVSLLGAWGAQRSRLEIETEDVATLVLNGGAGEQICIQLDYVSRVPLRRIHIVGDQASATWNLPQRTLELHAPGIQHEMLRDGFDTGAAYLDAMEELIEAMRSGGNTSLPLAEGMRATSIAIEANLRIRGADNQ